MIRFLNKPHNGKARPAFLPAISADFLLSLAAVFLSTGVMQLVLYPQLAYRFGPEEYGSILTVVGVVNVITLSFGNNLANSRIVRQRDYDEDGAAGDYPLLLAVSAVVSGAVALVYCVFVGIDFAVCVAVSVFAFTTVLKSYYLVAFRIVIDYRKNLVANAFLCMGYVLGGLVLIRYFSWPWAFTIANTMCIAYVLKVSRIAFEPLRITHHLKKTLRSYGCLIAGGLIGNVSTYLDRFIINPALGASSVAIFSVSGFFAKGASLAVAPLTGVLLSYFARGKMELNRRSLLLLNVAIIACCLFLFICSVTIGYWITQLLYPELFSDAAPYVPLVSLGVVIGIASGFNGVIVLSAAAPIWQTVIPAASLGVYVVLAILLMPSMGLWGVGIASVGSNALKLFLNLFVSFWVVYGN